jgi:hypothetical protein
MTARFNPPPGWPVPPAGWTPDASWRPDPSWPEPPPGWSLWIEEPDDGTTEQTMLLPVAGSAPAGGTGGTPGRTRRVVLTSLLGVGSLLLGIMIGSGSSGERVAAADATLAEAEEARASVDEDAAALKKAQDDLVAADADLAAREEAVVAAESALTTRESASAAAEADLQARLAAVEGREAAVTTAEADLQSRSAQSPPKSTPEAPAGIVNGGGGGGGGAVTYANCDAVRAAGKAPIRAGQPGYSSKLDRDGDGVGCE